MKQIAQANSGRYTIHLYFGWSSIADAGRDLQRSQRVRLSHRAGE